MSRSYTIGIDLGGTNIKGGVLDAQFNVVDSDSVKTEGDGGVDHVLGRMAGLARTLADRVGVPIEEVHAIGVGAPGPISYERGFIYSAPNIPGWKDVALRDRFGALVGNPRIFVENDANAAAFGEFVAGAGREARDMVMLTLGTGVGGGIVLGGRLLRGAFDNAGEIGHTIVEPGGRPCPCGQVGCLERYASANAVAERLIEAIEAGESSRLAPRLARGEPITSREVLAAAIDGCPLASRIWDETTEYLAIAIVNIQHMLNPKVVVLAGGLINAGEPLLEKVREHFARRSWKIAPDQPQIVFATLGAEAGTIGAAALARNSE